MELNGAGYIAVGVQSGKVLRPLLASLAGERAPPSSDTSAIVDLADSTISHPNAPPRIQKLGFQIKIYIYINLLSSSSSILLYRYTGFLLGFNLAGCLPISIFFFFWVDNLSLGNFVEKLKFGFKNFFFDSWLCFD